MDAKVKQAVMYAVGIAEDDTHGYDQVDRWGNPNFDCSGLVITAFQQAGIPVKTNGASYTGNMRSVFLKTGFEDVINKVNVSTGAGLVYGDVLLHQGKHTAIYLGEGKLVHASINENGKTRGGKSGDQTGKEICIRKYYNHPWDSVLRYVGNDAAKATASVSTPKTTASEVQYKTTSPLLRIRTGPGTNYAPTGKHTGIGVVTITQIQNGTGSKAGWGKLKSGAGWIALDYAKKV